MIGLRTSLWDPPMADEWLMNESLGLADLLTAMGVIPCDLRAGPKTRPDKQTIDTGTDTLAERNRLRCGVGC